MARGIFDGWKNATRDRNNERRNRGNATRVSKMHLTYSRAVRASCIFPVSGDAYVDLLLSDTFDRRDPSQFVEKSLLFFMRDYVIFYDCCKY